MSNLSFIKGKKIICVYDSLVKYGKLSKRGKPFHYAQYRIVDGADKKAYAVVSQPMSWVSSPKTIDTKHVEFNAKVEDWKLWCQHKNHPFPNLIKNGIDADRTREILEGHPFVLACKFDYRFEFVK